MSDNGTGPRRPGGGRPGPPPAVGPPAHRRTADGGGDPRFAARPACRRLPDGDRAAGPGDHARRGVRPGVRVGPLPGRGPGGGRGRLQRGGGVGGPGPVGRGGPAGGPDERALPRLRPRAASTGRARRTSSSTSTTPRGTSASCPGCWPTTGPSFFLTPNAPADFENPFHIHLFEPPELADMLGRHFHDVTVQGLDAVPHVKADFTARRVKADKVLALDVLDLRHRIPRSWYIGVYTRVAARGLPAHRPGRLGWDDRHHRRRLLRDRRARPRPPWCCSPPPRGRGARPDRVTGCSRSASPAGSVPGSRRWPGCWSATGPVLVDADLVAREVVVPGGPAYQPLIDRFGPGDRRAPTG